MKKYFFSIILGLFTGIFAFAQFSDEGITAADLETGVRPITIPVFNPESDRFFGNEFQNAFIRGKTRRFTFTSGYIEYFKIPDNLVTPEDRDSSNYISRISFAAGGMLPINSFLSLMGGISFAEDDVYIASTFNFFIGAGVFGHYAPWGMGIGILGGYYWNRYKELVLGDDGFYRGNIDDQPEKITHSTRFMIVPRISLSDKIIFLDELSANIGFSEEVDAVKILSRLAFRAIQIGAARFGIDVYYNQYKYNMLLDQRSYGARFDSKYLSLDFGYREFINTTNSQFVANYEDGMFGKIIAKLWIGNIHDNKVPILLTYGFERTSELKHLFGFGLQFGSRKFLHDSLLGVSGSGGDLFMSGVFQI